MKQTWQLSYRLSSQPPRCVICHLPLSVQEQIPPPPRVSVLQPTAEHLPHSSPDSSIPSPVLKLHQVLLPQSVGVSHRLRYRN